MTRPALEAPARALRPPSTRSAVVLGRLALLVLLLFGFLVAIQLMSGAFADLGRGSVGGEGGWGYILERYAAFWSEVGAPGGPEI